MHYGQEMLLVLHICLGIQTEFLLLVWAAISLIKSLSAIFTVICGSFLSLFSFAVTIRANYSGIGVNGSIGKLNIVEPYVYGYFDNGHSGTAQYVGIGITR